MANIALIAHENNDWAGLLFAALRDATQPGESAFLDLSAFLDRDTALQTSVASIYVPSFTGRDGMTPDLAQAERVFERCAAVLPAKLILLSSALIYGTGTARQGLVDESYATPRHGADAISRTWKSLEALACRRIETALVILRPVTVLPSPALLARSLAQRLTITPAGHDPTLQLLSLEDLAAAVLCAVRANRTGVFNVAPDGVIPVRAALRLGGGHRLALPRTWQRLAWRRATLDYLRYPWTVSTQKIKRDLGFTPRHSSLDALRQLRKETSDAAPEPCFDNFGMDRETIDRFARTIFKFMSDRYWRIELEGLEHIPRQGPGILAGPHRGFIPWDAVMALHLVLRETGRVPRFLTHPGLLKFPFVSSFITKMGGVVACQENAERVLAAGELLGVFPEGVQGAFTPCRQAYQLLDFGRDAFVKIALRNRIPIVPYVTVGNVEALPIFKLFAWRWWRRYSDWPGLPLSTFPFLPLPLPSKWHIRFLPAIHPAAQHGPEAAGDVTLVKKISAEVRSQMQQAIDDILRRRPSIFWGSVFARQKGRGAAKTT
ncbi:MAG TPA: 1-acyl-sn-glycerol-3-phosphate acyltransferase [Candidatus Angelobacter sp.]|nr:1-acyl-sn-glycerol-3-phosphate acyltransferase [Candidatus Angelobacter sp.]